MCFDDLEFINSLRGSTMKNMFCRLLLCLAVSVAVLVTVRSAPAALGGSADSVESDRRALHAVRGGATVNNSYRVQEMDYGGTALREYVSSAGIVFAITWNGIRHPDLTTLLGSYADSYREALQKTPMQPGARNLSLKANGIVVEKWGHVRSLHGRAYASDLIPPGVALDEIR
jgi:Protein of unknown function (DUF2844)